MKTLIYYIYNYIMPNIITLMKRLALPRARRLFFVCAAVVSFFSLVGSARAAAPTYNGDAAIFNGVPGAGTFGGNFTPALGANNILIAVVTTDSTPSLLTWTVNYGATAMTFLRRDCTGNVCQNIFYLINPTAGPLSLQANPSPNDWNKTRLMAFTYAGVNQATPIGAHAGTSGIPGSSPWSLSQAVTPTNAGSRLVQISNIRTGGCPPTSFSPFNGTTHYTNFSSINNTHGTGIADLAPGISGAPVSFNHTYTCKWGVGSFFNIAGIELLPLAGGATPTDTPTVTVTPSASSTPIPPIVCNGSLYNANTEAVIGGGPYSDPTAYNNWFYYFDVCATGSWSTAQSRSATHSLHIQSLGCGGNNGGFWIQNICGISTTCNYTFCTWVRSDTSSATSGIYIAIEQKDAAGADLGSPAVDYNISNANGVWVQHCITFNAVNFAAGFDHLRLVMGNQIEANNAWFDDMSFTQVCPSATPTITVTPSNTPVNTPTVTITNTETPGPTPTPSFPLVKSSNVSIATIGETITFCIDWTNDAGNSVNMVIWDTVAASITYQGCTFPSGSSVSCSESGGLVTWNAGSVSAGATGQVCFSAIVSGYPWWPLWQQNQFSIKPRDPVIQPVMGVNRLCWQAVKKSPQAALPGWMREENSAY